MKVSLTKNPVKNSEKSFEVQLGDIFISVTDTKYILNVKSGNKEIFFEGEIYYQTKENEFNAFKKNHYTDFLKCQIDNFDIVKFINTVEGIYTGVYIDKEKEEVIIFCDYLNRKNFFYTEFSNSFIASTKLDNIISEFPELKYNQHGLLSYLTMGYTPAHQTFYEGVNRFTSNEYIVSSNGNIRHAFFPENYEIQDYKDSDMERYNDLLSNSILSRSSEENFVLNSGGWDSTSIIYHLSKSYDSSKINSVVYETKLSSGDIYNVFEVDKVRRISEYYGIKSEKISIDFNDKSLLGDWDSLRDELKNYHTYFFPDMPKTIKDIGAKNSSASIFSGEASDSIHNFGFSQFVSVSYSNRELREYGDKMKSYLFSPSFFAKIIKNSFADDKVFRFFKFYFGESHFEQNENINIKDTLDLYFKSFMISSERVPFAKSIRTCFASESFEHIFNKNLSEQIFNKIASVTNHANFYYSLLQLYRAYHFHSPQIEVKHTPLRSEGKNCKIPFLDMSLVKFMYSMPEEWGRGLELRTTKYPLKHLAHKKWNVPVNILEEAGAHSYISESDKKWNYSGGAWNLNCEVIYNSVFGEHYKSILSNIELEKYFSSDYFNIELMKSVVSDYVNGKQDLAHSSFIYKLGVLFFIGLYE